MVQIPTGQELKRHVKIFITSISMGLNITAKPGIVLFGKINDSDAKLLGLRTKKNTHPRNSRCEYCGVVIIGTKINCISNKLCAKSN